MLTQHGKICILGVLSKTDTPEQSIKIFKGESLSDVSGTNLLLKSSLEHFFKLI